MTSFLISVVSKLCWCLPCFRRMSPHHISTKACFNTALQANTQDTTRGNVVEQRTSKAPYLCTGTLGSKLNKIEGCSHSNKLWLSYKLRNPGKKVNSNKYIDLSIHVTNFRLAPVVGPGIVLELAKAAYPYLP